MMAKYDRKQLMHRVEIALGELHLSSWTHADKKRLAYVQQGVVALDEEQALVKQGIGDLVETFTKALPNVMTRDPEFDTYERTVATLIKGLQDLVADPRPRVAYPDRKLVGPARREIPISGPAPSKGTVKQLVSVQKNLGKIPKTKAKVK